jgi:hypothetical protein
MNNCYRYMETRREYWTAGLGPIVAKRFKCRLRDIPSYLSISRADCQRTFADEAGTTTKMVPTDNGGHIPVIYGEFVEGFQHSGRDTRATSVN